MVSDVVCRASITATLDDLPAEAFNLIRSHATKIVIESVTGLENLEIRWRQATLREARIVVVQYHKYLVENSLIKFVVDEAALVPPIPPVRKLAKPEPAEAPATPQASAAA